MAFALAKDEVVIKSWDYAKTGHRFDRNKIQRNLTLTNKRVIDSGENKYSYTHKEIPVSACKSIDGAYRKNDSLWMKIKFVLSIIWCCTIIGAILGGLKAAIRLHHEIKSCILIFTITTSGVEGSSLAVGTAPTTGISQRTHLFSKTANTFKVYSDKEMGREILSELGAAILDAQNTK